MYRLRLRRCVCIWGCVPSLGFIVFWRVCASEVALFVFRIERDLCVLCDAGKITGEMSAREMSVEEMLAREGVVRLCGCLFWGELLPVCLLRRWGLWDGTRSESIRASY